MNVFLWTPGYIFPVSLCFIKLAKEIKLQKWKWITLPRTNKHGEISSTRMEPARAKTYKRTTITWRRTFQNRIPFWSAYSPYRNQRIHMYIFLSELVILVPKQLVLANIWSWRSVSSTLISIVFPKYTGTQHRVNSYWCLLVLLDFYGIYWALENHCTKLCFLWNHFFVFETLLTLIEVFIAIMIPAFLKFPTVICGVTMLIYRCR